LPRIGSGVLSAICAFIFMFPSNFEDHRLLGDYIRLYSVQWGLLILSAYAGIFFIFTWLREQSSKSQVEWLTTDEGMRDFIRHILLNKQGEEDPGKRRFSDRELIITLASDGNRNMFPFSVMLPMHSQVSRSVAEKIVQIHIDKYIQRGVIVELPQKGFDRIFEINKAAREDLKVQ
ncbi:MAG: hypothetical protein OEY50_11260, partial [Nitrospinota bacterium]|nr:hypothetical protein [Nitrospinota bacterium]